MKPAEARRRRGQEIIKRYKPISGADQYACATDAIADILLAVCENVQEASSLLQAAETDYVNAGDIESVISEG
jgi:hypothetical protein